LTERLAEAEKAGKKARQSASGDDAATEELRRRYDMAMDDLRELKAKNAELQEKLTQATAAGSQAAMAGGALDWEAQKEKILAALESDSDEGGEQAAEEHLKIEEIVENTDRVMAEKDREIEDLKRLLEDQSANVGSVAVGAAALGEILDNDQIIREQRESLEKLQKEAQEKLRQAEIEISVERAKIARERTEIEEKLRMLEEQGSAAGAQPRNDGDAGKPARGRWLSRLGLTDQDNQADK
jgi:chromosome segregation ATPase